MDKKYLKYSVADFTQDINFINWVNKGSDQDDWENFILENPTLSKDITTAKKIVSAFHYKIRQLHENEVKDAYEKIEIFYTLHHKSRQKARFRRAIQFAAIFALMLSIGTAISYLYLTQSNDSFTELPASSSGSDDAKLILSEGEEILLKEKQTDLQFNASGNQIKIGQDSIINYNRKMDDNEMVQLVIPYGKRSSILLSDGTKVWLNAGSKLIFPQRFRGKNRKVFLQGEAYFDVFRNRDIPFIVCTDNINVTVLGTEFNIKDYHSDNEMELVLVEGTVSMKEIGLMNLLGKETRLNPNQKAVYNKIENKTSVESNVNVTNYISWKEGLLEFNRESILNVFNKLSRFYNVHFVAENGVELNRKISGKLDLKDSLEDVMKIISDATPISYRIEEDTIFVDNKRNTTPMQ